MGIVEPAHSGRSPRVVPGWAESSWKYLLEPSLPCAPFSEDEHQSPAPLHKTAQAIFSSTLWVSNVIKNDHVRRREVGRRKRGRTSHIDPEGRLLADLECGLQEEAGITPRVGAFQHENTHRPSRGKHEVELIVLGQCIGVEPDRTAGVPVGEREGLERDGCRAGRIEAHGLGLNLLPIHFEHDGTPYGCFSLTADHTGCRRHTFLPGEEISPQRHRRHGGIRSRFIGDQHGVHQRSGGERHTLVAVPPVALEVADDDGFPVLVLGLFQDRLGQLQGRAVQSTVSAQIGRVQGGKQAIPIGGRPEDCLCTPRHQDQARAILNAQALEDLSSLSLGPLPAVAVTHRVRPVQYDDDLTWSGGGADPRYSVLEEGAAECCHE